MKKLGLPVLCRGNEEVSISQIQSTYRHMRVHSQETCSLHWCAMCCFGPTALSVLIAFWESYWNSHPGHTYRGLTCPYSILSSFGTQAAHPEEGSWTQGTDLDPCSSVSTLLVPQPHAVQMCFHHFLREQQQLNWQEVLFCMSLTF